MNQEDRDIYLIPPNFIEGGTLLGGMFRTRNVVEAGIISALVGLPILNLNCSLSTRIIILCLTALPLAMLALIGAAGGSLSSFCFSVILFFRNRRVLSRDGQKEEKLRSPLSRLSFIQRKIPPEDAAPDPDPLPKSRWHYQVDFKSRKVTQFKTFLPNDAPPPPLNQIADYLPIEKVEHGIIYTKDKRYVKLVEVTPINFLLRSAREQKGIILWVSRRAPARTRSFPRPGLESRRHLLCLFQISRLQCLCQRTSGKPSPHGHPGRSRAAPQAHSGSRSI